MHNYASLQETNDQYEDAGIPQHYVAEPTRSQWNHIENLDTFFDRVYKYHQKHGFSCIVIKKCCHLHQYFFTCCLSLTVFYWIDYSVIFGKPTHADDPHHHPSIFNILKPFNEVIEHLPAFGWFLVFFLLFLFSIQLGKHLTSIYKYWDIKQFYNEALKIKDSELDNLTWHNVQTKLKQAQLELQMCIHKRELTELDIYHRILRETNYLVALVNKRMIPPRIYVPLLGEVVYLTEGLSLNISFLLFWSPWSPFENSWHLREEYKRASSREKTAKQLGRQILWLCLANVLAMPLVFIGQIIFYFFNYFDLVRREPGKFGIRYWSAYARLYLRHFNELDHELHSRLTRAYKPAAKYMSSFSSPIAVVLAEHLAFMGSSLLAVFVCLSFIDNEIFLWDQVLTTLAVLTGLITICRNQVPDETQIWCPEALLEAVVQHTHYLPGNWQGFAHTSGVRTSFQQMFQYRFACLLEEFLSPILTPYFLFTYLYPRSLDIVDFFRHFTVSVVGVGDVCSFAQMDVRKHGNPDWQAEPQDEEGGDLAQTSPDQYTQAEDGKVELSLMHFTTTNPDWEPPENVRDFVDTVNQESGRIFDYGSDVGAALVGVLSNTDLEDEEEAPMGRVQSSMMLPRSSIYGRRSSGSANFVYSPPRTFSPRASLRQSFFVPRTEGPDPFNSINNMGASTFVLHNRFANRASIRIVRSAEETTPLLSNR